MISRSAHHIVGQGVEKAKEGISILSFAVGLAASISSVVLTVLFQFAYKKYKQRGLRAILNFRNSEITFIYPPRTDCDADLSQVLLPRTATEDFLAMNNFQSALLSINWNGNTYFKSSCDFQTIEKDKDLIFICSSNSNVGTGEVLGKLPQNYNCGIPKFRLDTEKDRMYLRIGGARYDSTTYDVVEECSISGKLPAEEEMIDYGIILKATNPWDKNRKIMVLAGIRGIGTWGAAECLKKDWEELYQRKSAKGTSKKTGDFIAVVKVVCNQSDLTDFEVEHFIDLD